MTNDNSKNNTSNNKNNNNKKLPKSQVQRRSELKTDGFQIWVSITICPSSDPYDVFMTLSSLWPYMLNNEWRWTDVTSIPHLSIKPYLISAFFKRHYYCLNDIHITLHENVRKSMHHWDKLLPFAKKKEKKTQPHRFWQISPSLFQRPSYTWTSAISLTLVVSA